MEERAFFRESETTKPATLNCPFCRTADTYELRWMLRKKLDQVLKYQGGTIKVLHRLRPLGVAMAGIDEYDPYKD